ncbi:uncharacterized protein LOC123674075 [Harmonia axyridis]|uniref:uncharacterized protein LOC123674075 n=1 Tax=Harmonia axyridis TaxID=115357 RepID=UPI001E2786A6|nr:uncharacterized protein LOC123674075 [Harmonia axyridis]XP_045464882.1 uncharacterized protein LOC123674075 [Harmonia axyridis]
MSKNRYLTRPRTKLYDANYNIGESYYKSALDSIDRKYSPRVSSTPPRLPSAHADLLERHAKAFEDEDLATSRRRAEKHITESNVFDTRGGLLAQKAMDDAQNDIDEETSSLLNRIRANRKKIAAADDVEMDSVYSNLQSRRMINRSDKILDSVGINDTSRRALDEQVSIKREMKMAEEKRNNDLTKWKPLEFEADKESAALLRARQTKNRLHDIEDEMADLAEKQEARKRRVAKFKALVAENSEETEAIGKALHSVSISSRKEERSVHF